MLSEHCLPESCAPAAAKHVAGVSQSFLLMCFVNVNRRLLGQGATIDQFSLDVVKGSVALFSSPLAKQAHQTVQVLLAPPGVCLTSAHVASKPCE
jgi:hypothetical protein